MHLVSVVLGSTLIATSARSDQASVAHALFEAGARARDAGDFKTACEKFLASQELDPAPGTTLNIADCKEQLGQLAQAWQQYTEAVERLPQSDPRAGYAASKAEELRLRLPRVTLEWKANQAAGSVYIDETPLPPSAIGVALPVDPGQHTYLVKADGHADQEFSVDLAEAENQTIELFVGTPLSQGSTVAKTETERSPIPSEAAPNNSPGWTKSHWGWLSVGVGGAGLLAGGVTGILAIDQAKTVKDDCDTEANFCRTQAGKDAADAGRTLATASTIAFAMGGIFTAVGVTLILVDSSHKTPKDINAARVDEPAFSLFVRAQASCSSLNLKGTF